MASKGVVQPGIRGCADLAAHPTTLLCVYGSCYNKEERLRQHNTVSMRRQDNGVQGGGSAGHPEMHRPSRLPHHNDTDMSRRSIQPKDCVSPRSALGQIL